MKVPLEAFQPKEVPDWMPWREHLFEKHRISLPQELAYEMAPYVNAAEYHLYCLDCRQHPKRPHRIRFFLHAKKVYDLLNGYYRLGFTWEEFESGFEKWKECSGLEHPNALNLIFFGRGDAWRLDSISHPNDILIVPSDA